MERPEGSRKPAERDLIRELSSRGKGRICPRCGRPTLVRRKRPLYLRWLRLVGIDLRTYECAFCGYEAVIRRRGDAHQSRNGRPVRRTRARSTRRRFVVALGGFVVVLAAVALFAFQVLSARQHLLAGYRALQQTLGRAQLSSPADVSRPDVVLGLADSESEFGDARSDLWLWSPFLRHLGWAPVIGGQLAAAPPAADSAYYATRSALDLLHGLSPVWPEVTAHRSHAALARLAPLLDAGSASFGAARTDADRAAVALGDVPPHSGSGTVDAARQRLQHILPFLRGTSRWLAAAPTVLGMRRPSHYVILLQDSAELRATGGFIGAVDYVTIAHGWITNDVMSSGLPRDIDTVAPPLPEALYTGEGYWIFPDSNWSPDFPLSARLARWFYGEDTGRWADGVAGCVDTVVRPLLAATGPVYVPAYRRVVGADNVETLAQRYINGLYHGPTQQGSSDTIRKQFFGHVIAALFVRIQSLPLDRWPALAAALSQAASTRDIQIYDPRPDVTSAIHMSGTDGSLRAPPSDFIAVIDDNRSYNKINPYVDEWADYHVDVLPDLWLNASLTIHYRVRHSPPDLMGQGPGFGSQGTVHDYEDFVRVYVPAGSRLTSLTGVERWAPEPAYGLAQFAGRLIVREGQTSTVTIRYHVPANVFSQSGFGRYVLHVRHQAGGNLAFLHVAVRAGRGVTLGAPASTAVTRTLRLDRDVHLQIPLHSPGQPRVVPLPSPSGPIDPYIPFSDIRDPRHPL